MAKEVIYDIDGNQHCAFRPGFTNLADCNCGFGDSQEEALKDLQNQEAADESPSMAYEEDRGMRLIGPHGGVKESMPCPDEMDLRDPLFNAIWSATKKWDVNSPDHYKGYCSMTGSHVMVILNAVRKVQGVI